jgi:hypothetical protein
MDVSPAAPCFHAKSLSEAYRCPWQNNTKNRLEHQQAMLRQMHPNQQNINMIRMNGGMPGGMNPMAMKPGQNSLPRTAMANSQNK